MAQVEDGVLLDRAFASGLAPPREVGPVEWLENHRVLSSKAGSAIAGNYSVDHAPYQREPLESLADSRVRRVVCPWGAQTGKTDGLIHNALVYWTGVDPSNILYVFPTETMKKKGVTGRLIPTVQANPSMFHALAPRKRAMNEEGFEFQRCMWYFGLAGSDASLASLPLARVVIDELDNVPQAVKNRRDFVEKAEERQKTFWYAKTLLVGTPGDEWGIWYYWKQSDMRVWTVPCLSCGEYQEFEHEQLRTVRPIAGSGYSALEWANRLESGMEPVRYYCKHCGHAHEERDKLKMNRVGVYEMRGAVSSTRGYHVNSLASQMFKWRDYLAKWFRSYKDPDKLRVFQNSNRALPWVVQGKRGDLDMVLERRNHLPKGVVPQDARCLTVGADMHDWGVRWNLQAAMPELRLHYVDWGTAQTLEELFALVLSRLHPVEQGGQMAVSLGLADARYRGLEVYRFCVRNPSASMVPVIGQRRIQRSKDRLREIKAQTPEGEVSALELDTSSYKDSLFDLFEKGRVSFPSDVDFEYARQYMSEECVEEKNARTGFVQMVWQKRQGIDDNHDWDCAVYALAAVDVMGFFTWDAQESRGASRGRGQASRGGTWMNR